MRSCLGWGPRAGTRAEACEGEACYKSVRPCQNVIKINITWAQEREEERVRIEETA